MRTTRILLALGALLLAGCPEKTAPAPPSYAHGGETPPAAETVLRLPRYSLLQGVGFVHSNGATPGKLMPETMSGGVSLVDIDGDGKLDLLFPNGRRIDRDPSPDDPPPLVAYKNLGDGGFEDVTEKLGFAALPKRHAMGVYAAHALSMTGPPDLFLTAFDGALFLRWRDGKYVDATAESGLAPPSWKDENGNEHPAWSTAAAWFDADGDGRLDLLVGHYIQWTKEKDLQWTVDGKTKIYATPEHYTGISPRLYRQTPDGRFEDATAALGFENPKSKTLGIALGDLAGNGRFAVAVANDTEPNNLYVWKDGKYVDEGLERGVAVDEQGAPRAGMGLDLVQESAGSWTLAVGNFSRQSTALYRGVEKSAIDRAPAAGLAQPTRSVLTFGLAFLDVDRDGRLDLLLANGHIEPTVTAKQKEIAYEQTPQLFRSRAGGKLEDVGEVCGLTRAVVGRGLALGDLDGDGFVDFVIAVNGGAPLVYRCEPPRNAGHALRIDLRGKAPNPDALGALVTVKQGDRVQAQSRRTAGSYLSQHEGTLTFGLGVATRADQVTVRWPSGKTEELGPLEAKQHVIEEK
jgi:hypothetical protein